MSALDWLSDWYSSQCNGDWEHQFGVEIGTLDNPGWQLKIDLDHTPLQDKQLDPIKIERTETDWLHCWKSTDSRGLLTVHRFEAACGPKNLEEVIMAFKAWSEG